MSPISSRNRVPPCAAWNRPRRSATAPVNEPFLWPNSSDSSRPSGIAPQFTATKASAARAGAVDRARSSLPVPLAPKMHTLASEAATRFACDSMLHAGRARHDLDAPVLGSPPGARQAHGLGHGFEQHLGVERLGQKAEHPAPRRRHRLGNGAVRGEDDHRGEGDWRWMASNSAMPSMPSMRRSVTTTWGAIPRAR